MARNYRVLITTSGLGQRLGEITKFTNKALVRVGKKPAISYIIESHPRDVEFVITLRHFGKQVKDFLKIAYPHRSFIFVKEPDQPSEGTTFSLGRSMFSARRYLTRPFIFQCCDTLVTEKIPQPNSNWNGVAKGAEASQYSTVNSLNGYVNSINSKGAQDFDYLHIGLVGVRDYNSFWKGLQSLLASNPNNSNINDCMIINKMIQDDRQKFKLELFPSWMDVGNIEGLSKARNLVQDSFSNLDKNEESIFIFDKFVIKFFFDKKIVKNRVKRSLALKKLVPNIIGTSDNFYKYKFVQGELYSRVVTPEDFANFLNWSNKNLWKDVFEIDRLKFHKACFRFYYDKTQQRVNEFLTNNNMKDLEQIINGVHVPTLETIFRCINWQTLKDGYPSGFHGDLILDNILRTAKGYCLLDWRQDFGEFLNTGDKYYDLAKLNHNLIVNHDIVNQNLYNVSATDQIIQCDILRKNSLVGCQQVLSEFIKKQGLDLKKVKIISALIWLNMTPLHHYPFNLFLYYFGKLNLWQEINRN